MRLRIPSFWKYAGALALMAGVVAIRIPLAPHVGSQLPYSGPVLAVLAVAALCGLGPTIVAALTATIMTTLFVDRTGGRTAIFLVTCGLIVLVVESLRRAYQRAERNAQLAASRLDQLRAEMARHEDESRLSAQLRAIVDSSSDAIISSSLAGVVRSWNDAATQIFGYGPEEIIGQPISQLVPQSQLAEELEIQDQIRRGGRAKHFETVRRRKDGKEIHVSLTISPIHDPYSGITGISHIARDISEQKQFEEQVRQMQKVESLGVLAGGLAHDFNNLLTGILGNASLLQDAGDEESQERAGEIVQASERAALLVRQMLAYAGKGRFVVEALDLSKQVTEILPLCRPSIRWDISIDLDLDPDLPLVEGDRAQIQQLVMNLILNGAEAIGDQQGSVRVSTRRRENAEGLRVVLEVQDTGQGMSEDVKARIFDPFFTTKFAGRGLGLSAVQGIVRKHRAQISVESSPGQGARFCIDFPAVPAIAKESEPAGSNVVAGTGTVLVADDEPVVRSLAKSSLEQFGYGVVAVEDGQKAVAAFAERPNEFLAVVLDLTMPVMSGEDALREIRRIRPATPVLLSSGYHESEARTRFQDPRPSGFLQKPYTARGLVNAIQNAVRGSHANAGAGAKG